MPFPPTRFSRPTSRRASGSSPAAATSIGPPVTTATTSLPSPPWSPDPPHTTPHGRTTDPANVPTDLAIDAELRHFDATRTRAPARPAAAATGDRQWRRLLDSHDRIEWDSVDRHRGTIVKSTGDGPGS